MSRTKSTDSPIHRLPPMTRPLFRRLPREITPGQSRVLLNLFDQRDAKHGFTSAGGHGGAEGAIGSLFRRGLLRRGEYGQLALTADGVRTAADLKGGRR
jgi:hypothetical protein